MGSIDNYCPVVGKCQCNVSVDLDTYFLIQPFDEEKENREDAITTALDKFYSNRKGSYPNGKAYLLKKSDSEINSVSVYCDICKKIKSSQYCIVDITGKCYTISNGKTTEKKIFLRPNVPLELGMSYGLNKPVFVLSRKIDGKREIPSDIQFIRYIDIPSHSTVIELGNWEAAAQRILDHFREALPQINIKTFSDKSIICEDIKKYLEYAYLIKKMSKQLNDKNIEINRIIYRNWELIGIITDGEFLKEDLLFNFYITDDQGIEEQIGIAQSYHIQKNGKCQLKISISDSTPRDYFEQIFSDCDKNGIHFPKKNRLELIIPTQLNSELKMLEHIFQKLVGES